MGSLYSGGRPSGRRGPLWWGQAAEGCLTADWQLCAVRVPSLDTECPHILPSEQVTVPQVLCSQGMVGSVDPTSDCLGGGPGSTLCGGGSLHLRFQSAHGLALRTERVTAHGMPRPRLARANHTDVTALVAFECTHGGKPACVRPGPFPSCIPSSPHQVGAAGLQGRGKPWGHRACSQVAFPLRLLGRPYLGSVLEEVQSTWAV